MTNQTSTIKEKVMEAYHFRHATKLYDPNRKISDNDFKFILEAGRLSPSSLGSEPWKFLIVQSPELRNKLMEVAPGAVEKLKSASHFVILLARKNVRYDSNYLFSQMKDVQQMPETVVTEVSGHYKRFQEQKQILDNERTLFDWASKQTYIALGNMLTAAALLGIDSTPMEGFNQEKLDALLEEEGLLENGQFGASVLAAFGYRKEDPKRGKTRRNIEEVAQWV
ncbi:NAD(P)H-dependent oxidoreductase [Virgibacillus halodenitrificans]|uniref:NAD(P)H-dependent oxidoreductase n=1 Tax=Virgibacillus halodenitrificans TaxID=1482 RepID=A0AAC9IW02_VIRHA|nr:NAD(P)H-dependent oxidoreductase [Virgibacillus halodenitrificans]APC47206.1 NAD(P)H-dependent oxidoreductase [Virgibacillus halodenitrificans]